MSTIDVQDADPIFTVTDGGYYVGVWCLFGHKQDVMAMVYRNPGDDCLQLTYRFRYYNDDKVNFEETTDRKSAYSASFEGKTEEEAIDIVDGMMRELIERGFCGSKLPWLVKKRYHRRIVRGDNKAMIDVILKMPNMHSRMFGRGGN